MSDLGNKEIFAKNLKFYMELNKKNKNDLARDLDLPYTTITSWYNGEFYPRIDKIQLLANYFDIKKSDLVEDKSKFNNNNKRAFPLLGLVKAGYDYLASENIIGYVSIDKNISDPENYFALKVTGDSMQPVLYENDIVIVRKQNDIENGQIAIVIIDGEEATVKKIIKYDDYIELVAFNSYYPPKRLTKNDNFKIIGKVIEARISKIFE